MAREPEMRFRRIVINVETASGDRLSGAHIEVSRSGALLGSMTSSGRSSVEIEGLEPLNVRASIPGANAQSTIGPNQTEITLRIATNRFVELASTPTARCPDGTSGQPCVTCVIDGRQIRICG